MNDTPPLFYWDAKNIFAVPEKNFISPFNVAVIRRGHNGLEWNIIQRINEREFFFFLSLSLSLSPKEKLGQKAFESIHQLMCDYMSLSDTR